MEVLPRNGARSLLLICLLLILIVLLQILFIQRRLLLNSFELVKTPCVHGAGLAQSATTAAEDGENDLFLFRYNTDYKQSELHNHKQIVIHQLAKENSTTAAKQLKHYQPPNCLIIGVRKGGTRALLVTIALHPDVKVAKREVHFFDKDENYRLGHQWYRQQMPLASHNQVVIEKTPAYFISPQAPARVHSLNAQMKLILIVRDPVVRLISDFTQVCYNKLELNKTQVPFKKAVLKANSSSLNHDYKPVRNSLYDEHLARWLAYFPLNQMLVLNGDDFIRDPLKQLRLTEKFLNLELKISADQLVFNKRKGFYCFRRKHKRVARCLGQTKGRVQVPVDNTFQKFLAKQFHAHNQRFFSQINRSFPSWST